MKKILNVITGSIFALQLYTATVSAAPATHTVVSGDSLWKIAVKYQIGVSELIAANPQIANPNLIYPGQIIKLPAMNAIVLDYEQTVIDLVNNIRQQNSLGTLKANWELSRVARYKSQDMADNGYFAHNSPIYGSPATMIKNFGISARTSGENIAKGYRTPQEVVNGWMNSSGHRANILNASYTQIGVGYTADGNHWTQMFIG